VTFLSVIYKGVLRKMVYGKSRVQPALSQLSGQRVRISSTTCSSGRVASMMRPFLGMSSFVDGLKEKLLWSDGCLDWQRAALRRLCLGADLDPAERLEDMRSRTGVIL
jgi:hypothetical protein